MPNRPALTVAPGPDAPDEITRQLCLIRRERWQRIGLTNVAFALCAIFVPVWIVLICALANLAAEFATMMLMERLDPARMPWRYRLTIFVSFVMEISFTLPPILAWHSPDDYAKAFAVGMVMSTLLQLATVRALHQPFGLAGITGVAVVIIPGNAVYWIDQNDAAGLVLSTVAALTGLAYAIVALYSNYGMHAEIASARRAAQEGERAKGRFLAQMSHELRTPLNAILGMGHAELRRNRDMLSQQRLSVLMASAEGLSSILDDILDLTAIQEGRMPIRRQPVNPSREITAAAGLFQPGIEAAGLALRLRIDSALDRTDMADAQRLRQCLSNLLSNALKHTQEGEIRVTAQRIDLPDGTARLQIDVADSGSGVPEHLHELVFEPFCNDPGMPVALQKRQGGIRTGTTAPPALPVESNGLGLSISRALARQMGGDLVIIPSREDGGAGPLRGAVFRLTIALPALPERSEALENATTAPVATQTANPAQNLPSAQRGRRLRVLVVDDIATNRLVAATYLRMLGAGTVEAASGEEALRLLVRDLPDLVLLDMNMPGMDGRETIRQIRALPDAPGRIPVIAMTADALIDHRAQYLASGVDGYLSKPLNPDRMAAEIAAVLPRRDDGPEPEPPPSAPEPSLP
ncbi:response regulator [Szabonella alba]|uniref:histidine kinase n=1 Tax=Szabonella alba TaxID=2804194 RepID=A0A8K0VAQ4_9RHOB|nr:response regulator [Szabonella alba]MBL4916334.1 response regulator [Szabonella alba]